MSNWIRIRDVFEQAVELDGEARERYLDEQCGSDGNLRSEVLRLLAADGASSLALEELADELIEDLSTEGPQVSLVGHTIGAFEVRGVVASGGMGTVYEAVQRQPERKVALKVMKREFITGDGRRRFEYETQVLARLRHPGIAQIYEAGSYRDELSGGEVPFFAMEFIEGARSILDYAREEDLDLGAKLELFEKVCATVHYGHQQGVIHRDLKPRNILVDYFGRPKVIDFGIARAVQPTRDSSKQTRSGEILGTVQYMSPEQMAGDLDAIDTRADIYALGIVLYELLCGSSPFPLVGKSLVEAARIVTETQPARPDRVRPDLAKELVWVVLKALEKEPDRRYTSAAELGEEIRRFLADLPVLAGPPSVRYRLKKFLQRNKSEALIAGLLLVVITVGPVVTSLFLARVNTSLQTANARYGRLADCLRLEELEERAQDLWPATPDRIGALRDWVRDAAPVRERLKTHEQTLANLRSASQNIDSAEIRWQYQVLEELVADLGRFADPDPTIGTFASVQERLDWARKVERQSVHDHEAEWNAACAAIASSPFYAGLRIEPQLGLTPIGENPQSGLWEFAHLASGAPAQPGPDGTLILGPETGLVFVLMPPGRFLMGAWPTSADADAVGQRDPFAAGDEAPVTGVELDAFLLSKYEMSQAQWERLAGDNPSYFTPELLVESSPLTDEATAALHPVEQVTWLQSTEVLRRYRLDLPTEAQWEYAARGGTNTVWWTGDDVESLRGVINIADEAARRAQQDWATIDDWPGLEDGYPFHAQVDAFLPNPFGLYNVLGNIYEWCRDEIADYSVEPHPGTGERHGRPGAGRNIRGGSFLFAARKARSADRGSMSPSSYDIHVGLRPMRSLDKAARRGPDEANGD